MDPRACPTPLAGAAVHAEARSDVAMKPKHGFQQLPSDFVRRGQAVIEGRK